MSKLTDTDVMPFGAHKGKPLINIPDEYFLWLWDQVWFQKKAKTDSTYEKVHAYIEDSLAAIKANVSHNRKFYK